MPAAATGLLDATLAEAVGATGRKDPVLPTTGGPAGNAVLTAWTGLVILALSLAELLTLWDVHGLLTWHVAIGALLIPPALLKTGTTGWRIARYYTGNRPYVQAGPPPTLLRLLGPLVVLSTLALLATGALLVVLGQQTSRTNLVSVFGFQISWLTLHQAAFIAWATVTGLHLLGRIVPAVRTVAGGHAPGQIPGRALRFATLTGAALAAVALAIVLVHADSSWSVPRFFLYGGSVG